jgi:hypothetical protein
MTPEHSVQQTLANDILDRVESLLLDAEAQTRPLEIDPYRSGLFELFVTAEAAGLVAENAEPDLTADGVSRELARRWGLTDAARDAFSQQTKLPPEHLSKMRLLWGFMRMWMEWAYAWQRWPEFHADQPQR